MKSGDTMLHYSEVFNVVVNQRTAPYAYDVTLIESDPDGNIVPPGVQPTLRFLFSNNLDRPIEAEGKLDVIAYGTRSISGDIWQSDVYKIADLPALPLRVSLPAKGSQVIEIHPALPETFGAYAFVADLGTAGGGRRFATSCVRAFAPVPAKIQYPKLSLDDIGIPVLHGLGVQAIRMGVAYVPTSDPNYPAAMAKLDATLRAYADKNITVMLMFWSGPALQPLGRGRPHLDENNVMLDTKQDYCWMPQDDPDFRKFVADIGKRQGWPRGPVTSMLLWNEPWEGSSISGWGADTLRYREIFTAMAQGVEEARAAGAQILIAGCDSSSNTFDKLFPDGTDTMLKWLDVCSIHYQGLTSPSLFRKWIDRKSPNGRVRIWDTESWVANTPDRVAAVIAADRAAGYDRAMGIYGGNITTQVKRKVTLPDKSQREIETYTVWPPAVAVAAAQHFLGERDFRKMLFQNGLPWVMVFDGLKEGDVEKPDDGTVVVVGDLREQFGDILANRGAKGLAEVREKEALRQALAALPAGSPERAGLEKKLAAPGLLSGGTLTLRNPAKEFVLYDFYGNVVPPTGDVLMVPLDWRGFFLRTTGAAGSFARLTKAIADGRVEGYQPLIVVAHDLLSRVTGKGTLRLTLTNIVNRPITGNLAVSLGDLKLDAPASLSFGPNEVKEVEIPVLPGAERPDNTYPLAFRFDAASPADGFAVLRENLHVNQFAKRTIRVDGSLDDWKGVLPEPVQAKGDQGPTLMESAWLPFAKFDVSQKSGFATSYLAYDEKNFYFAAKIADDSPSSGALRYEKRNDDDYFYPAVSLEYDRSKTLLKKDQEWNAPTRLPAALFLPDSKEKSVTAWSSVAEAFAVDLAVPEGTFRRLTLYFVDSDEYMNGRRRTVVEVQDAATGRKLAETTITDSGPGTYATFRIAGKVRLVIRSRMSWLPATVSGLFFDPETGGGMPKTPTDAEFVGIDITSGASWQGRYGRDGFQIVGDPKGPRYPDYAVVALPEVVAKVEHAWPEGVRRYSYRKNPDLPFGSVPKFDNVQIAFNVVPADKKEANIAAAPGVPAGFVPAPDTDYEYALNQVAEKYGGGTEVWRCLVPGMPRKHFYPRQPASPFDGPVKNAQLRIWRDGNSRFVECAIPWSEMPLVKKAIDAGKTACFSYRVNDDKGPAMELAMDRSVSRKNAYAFHPDWVEHWANQVEFSFEK
ncbi:hypothetical protein [Verrucomicrobium sp. GAS474]|uniref:hypothetical protein n=1 Tax=Verrucomicrobium sp. GAS474 TaxID=1882831 RepID=UPI0012FF75AA|nr:hypothetical protein [Verrucomicrobium sp. GAS474]